MFPFSFSKGFPEFSLDEYCKSSLGRLGDGRGMRTADEDVDVLLKEVSTVGVDTTDTNDVDKAWRFGVIPCSVTGKLAWLSRVTSCDVDFIAVPSSVAFPRLLLFSIARLEISNIPNKKVKLYGIDIIAFTYALNRIQLKMA